MRRHPVPTVAIARNSPRGRDRDRWLGMPPPIPAPKAGIRAIYTVLRQFWSDLLSCGHSLPKGFLVGLGRRLVPGHREGE